MELEWRRGLDLDWAFDLVSPDPDRRRRARERHAESEATYWEAQHSINELWAQTDTLHPTEPHLSADMEQRLTAGQDAYQYLLIAAIGEFTSFGNTAFLPYALLFLEWEESYPDEWPTWWGTKKHILGALARTPKMTPDARDRLQQLIIQVVTRPHRCEDQRYARLARTVLDPDAITYLRTIHDAAARREVRERAGYLLHLLAHPRLPATRATWNAWLKQSSADAGSQD